METYVITAPSLLRATVALPASKSISNRALTICALAGSSRLPDNLSDCDDTEVTVQAIATRQAASQQPVGTASDSLQKVIDIKAAGTAMRFMTALTAATPPGPGPATDYFLTGTERMKHRPISILVDALRCLGAEISYAGEEGFPPLRIRGRQLEGGQIEMSGSTSSQYVSALLLIGPVLEKGLTLRLTGQIVSRTYIDLTLWTMREFGADAEWTAVDTIRVKPGRYRQRPYLIENDWSAASYWYEMVALTADTGAEVRLQGLTDGSKQGDSVVRYIFSLLGVKTTFDDTTPGTPTTVTLRKSGHRVHRMEYDFTNAPDLAQTVVCTCCAMGVPFHFTGLQTLKIKETDRIEALKCELGKLGFDLKDKDGCELTWEGELHQPSEKKTAIAIDTYEDHRMAMAFAPLALKAPVCINHPEVVRKSYPHFWSDMRCAGFRVESK